MKKKLLSLILLLATGAIVSAQPGWKIKWSGYDAESRGISYINILDSTNLQVAWTIAYDGSGNGADISAVGYTNDGGETWTTYDPVELPGIISPGIGMVFATGAQTAYIAAYKRVMGNGGVWKTTDAGQTWTKVSSESMFANSASFCNIVYFFDPQTGITQGDPINGEFEIYKTTDGGNTWTPVDGANIDDPLPEEYGYVHGIVAAGNTVWFTTSKGRLYRSRDQGDSWQAFDTPLNDFGGNNNDWGSVTFKDDNEGWILRHTGEIFHTTDGGETWSSMGDQPQGYASDITFVKGTPNTLVAVGADAQNNHAGAAISRDGGVTWQRIDRYYVNNAWIQVDPTAQIQHTSVAFRDINFGLSGGFSHRANTSDPNDFDQGIYIYVDDIMGIAGSVIDGLRVYPNPATAFVNVSVEKSPLASVEVYDLTGKVVFRASGIDDYNYRIRTSSFQKGMYVIKVEDQNGNQQAVKLMIK